MNRRAVLLGLLAAPAIVKASSLDGLALLRRSPVKPTLYVSDFGENEFDWLAEVRAHRMSDEFIRQWGPTSIRVSPNTYHPSYERWDGRAWRPIQDDAEVYRQESLAARSDNYMMHI